MSRPFVYFGSALFISLMIYSYCGVYTAAAVFLVSAICSVPVFLLRKKHALLRKIFTCICALLLSSSLFTFKTILEYEPAQTLCTDSICTVSGTVYKYSNDYSNHYYTLSNISVDGKQTNLKIRINSKYKADAEIDDKLTVSVRGIYSLEDSVSALNYKSDGIYIRAYSSEKPEVLPAERHSPLFYFDAIRRGVSDSLTDIFPTDSAAVADALLTGNKASLSRDIQLNFSHSGISHLFAVSGFHLTFWTSAIYMLLRNLPGRNKKLLQSIISIIFVIFFMGITGFTDSVVRAGIMQIILFSGGFIRRKSDPLNSLFIALTLILTANPFAVTSISLQMSFFATLGLITLGEPAFSLISGIKPFIRPVKIYKIISSLLSTALISLIASLFTVFVSAVTFDCYSFASPLTNLLCVPVAQLIMPLSIIGTAFSFFPPASSPCIFLCNVIIKYILTVSEFIADLSWAVIDAQSSGVVLCLGIITFAVIISVVAFRKKRKLLYISVAVCSAAFLVLSVATEITETFTHKITVCSVGNGSAVILRSGNRNIILGCGGDNNSEYIFTNNINNVNTKSFDLLLIPRNTETEASYAGVLAGKYSFDNVLATTQNLDISADSLLDSDAKRSNEGNVRIDGRTNLLYINNDRFSGARIESPDFTCTIIYKATSDFSAVPEGWSSADLLITRESLPRTDLSRFDNIFISTDRNIIYDNPNIYSTKTDGTLRYVTTLTGGEIIYAD